MSTVIFASKASNIVPQSMFLFTEVKKHIANLTKEICGKEITISTDASLFDTNADPSDIDVEAFSVGVYGVAKEIIQLTERITTNSDDVTEYTVNQVKHMHLQMKDTILSQIRTEDECVDHWYLFSAYAFLAVCSEQQFGFTIC